MADNNVDKNIARTYTNNVNNIIISIQDTILDVNRYRITLDIDDPNRRYIKTQLKEYCNTGVYLNEHYDFIDYMGHMNYFYWDEYDEVVTSLTMLLKQVQMLKNTIVA